MSQLFGSKLELQVPNTWEDRSVYTYLCTSSDNPDFKTNLVVARERKKEAINVATYADNQLSTLRQQFPDLKIDETSELTISGKPALNRVFHFSPQPHLTVLQQQAYVVTDEWVYTLTFSTTPSQYPNERKIFTDMIAQAKVS